jgi:PIN domain nuclease of toxin-antitoxin system
VRFVLDTDIWIWSLLTPDRLSTDVRAVLSDPEPKLNLSAISVWETLVLIRKGRLRVTSTSAQSWITDALGRSPVCEVPVSFEVVMASEQLTLDHWDPADRFIAATARVLDATLITADERLVACPGIGVLPNQG